MFSLTKKLFLIINSNNQELIHHIHCLRYKFYHQSNTKKFCWFYKFVFYYLYFFLFIECHSFNISYSTKHLCISYDLLLQEHFHSHLLTFLCSLLSSNKKEHIFDFNLTNSFITMPADWSFILPTTNLFDPLQYFDLA